MEAGVGSSAGKEVIMILEEYKPKIIELKEHVAEIWGRL